MSTNDWLAQLNVGDTVVACYRDGRLVNRIVRRTATMLVLANGDRFNRKHGSLVGAQPFHGASLEEATPDVIEEIRTSGRRKRLAKSLSHRNWLNLPLSVLEQVNAVLEAHANAEKEG